MFIRALASAIKPRLKLTDADGVLSLQLLDANRQASCRPEFGVGESAAPEFCEREYGRFEQRRRGYFDGVFQSFRIGE